MEEVFYRLDALPVLLSINQQNEFVGEGCNAVQ